MKSLKHAVRTGLALAGAFPTALTETDQLAGIVRRLHPQAPAVDLVRLGPAGDGGYLVPDDLGGVEACFSPGVATTSGFERDCADRGMRVFLADNSVDGPADYHERFHFTKKNVGVITSSEFMTMDDWVASCALRPGSDLLLQIDIEGGEWEVFLGMSDSLLKRFRIIVAEMHDLHLLWSRPFFALASRAIEKLLQYHSCVHIHPNNVFAPLVMGGLVIPPLMEFTFLRSERLGPNRPRTSAFPHPLDADNTARPALPLPACWHG